MCTDKRSIPKEDMKNYNHYSPRSPQYIELGVVVLAALVAVAVAVC